MTTIAASVKHQSMSADSRMSFDDTTYSINKIKQLKDGSLLGFSGSLALCLKMIDYIELEAPAPDVGGDLEFEIVILRKNGIELYPNQIEPVFLLDQFCGSGTGGKTALAAMRCGKTPKQAVEMALTVDANSCGPVYTLRIP